MITITMNNDFTLNCDTNIIPAQYSANIPFKLELPEEYQNSLIIPGYVYYDGCRKVESAADNYSNGNFTLPANAFSKEGMLAIAFAITTGEETVTTTTTEFEVRGSVNTSFSLPSTEIWQSMLQNFMEQYMDKVYSSEIRELIDEAKEEQKKAAELQTAANKIITNVKDLVDGVNTKLENGDFIPNIQIGTVENGETASATITGEKNNPILNLVLPKGEQGPQGEKGEKGDIGQQGPQGPQGEGVLATHIVTELPETGESSAIYFLSKNNNYTAYMYVDGNWIPFGNQNSNQRPKQLLINNEFRINQRGQSEYNFDKTGKYGIDGWQHRQGNYTNAIIVKPLAYGGCNVKLNTSAGAGLRQYLNEEDFIIRHNYTTAIYIDGIIYTGTSELYNNSGVIIENDIFKLDFYYDTTRRKVVYFIWFKNGNSEYTIEYCDLFEGTTVHEHVMDDKYTTLLKCQRRYINSNYFAINNQLVKNLREYDYHYWSISYLPVAMDSVPTITLNNDYIISHAYDSTTYYPDELSDVVNICDKNAVLLGFFNNNFVEGEEYRLYNVFIELSCEPH